MLTKDKVTQYLNDDNKTNCMQGIYQCLAELLICLKMKSEEKALNCCEFPTDVI